jgi:hypothetical protein
MFGSYLLTVVLPGVLFLFYFSLFLFFFLFFFSLFSFIIFSMLFIYLSMPNWCETQFPYQMSLASCSNNTTVAAAGGVGTANPSLPLVGFMLLILYFAV